MKNLVCIEQKGALMKTHSLAPIGRTCAPFCVMSDDALWSLMRQGAFVHLGLKQFCSLENKHEIEDETEGMQTQIVCNN